MSFKLDYLPDRGTEIQLTYVEGSSASGEVIVSAERYLWQVGGIFTISTAFQVVGEKLGIIATGSTTTDTAPINPEAGVPYFTLKADG